ncbi:Crp/Fnr family transcriptional regulator [Aurantiacibacter gangjinensis]|uniref:Transcriptional regulator n=1 Tax=Aurantiacibacter gangjinensis TaxID=502682 RepID=A0A0G9MPH2_9SPHN|nr:Crp/Fnr family transcriptional regulator [Aurantiacibacter gangjinensis]KLE31183.1 transcriptional regulator [Aurantiacibacter gangjinensis]
MNDVEIQDYPKTGRFLAGRLRSALDVGQKQRIEELIAETRTLANDETIIHAGETCDVSTILIEGFMLRTIEEEGERHAVSFHVPGDFVDMHCFALKRLDHNIQAVGTATIGLAPHDKIRDIMATDPDLARLFWFGTLLDAAMHREWIVKLGKLRAAPRIAHILAEISRRLDMVGLGDSGGFDTPLRQRDIADTCGITVIHANRAIKKLRELDLADVVRGRVNIPDRKRLEAYAKFHPQYLYGDSSELMRDRLG